MPGGEVLVIDSSDQAANRTVIMTDEAIQPGTRYFRAGQYQLAYHVYGEGDLIIAIPGGPGFSHHYLRMPELEHRFTVLYLDNLGTGLSDRLSDPADYSRALDVINLEALRAHLRVDRLTLIGHSAGGFIAQEYALAYPDHVERLVLYDTTPTNQSDFDESLRTELAAREVLPKYQSAISAFREAFSRILDQDEANVLMREALKLYLYDFEQSGQVLTTLRENSEFDVVRMQQGSVVDFDYRQQLSSLDLPALVITGARDFICAPRLAAMIHECLPGSQLVTMERSGHLAHIEEPDRFAGIVSSFLLDPA